jgi:ankyrin repeat protein
MMIFSRLNNRIRLIFQIKFFMPSFEKKNVFFVLLFISLYEAQCLSMEGCIVERSYEGVLTSQVNSAPVDRLKEAILKGEYESVKRVLMDHVFSPDELLFWVVSLSRSDWDYYDLLLRKKIACRLVKHACCAHEMIPMIIWAFIPGIKGGLINTDVLLAVVKTFLKMGADVERLLIAPGQDGKLDVSPLVYLTSYGCSDLVGIFIEFEADVNRRCGLGTPVEVAAQTGNVYVMNLLLEKGAQIDGISADHPGCWESCSLLKKAAVGGHKAMVRFLIEDRRYIDKSILVTHCSPPPMWGAGSYNSAGFIKMLGICGGLNLAWSDDRGRTALHLAAIKGNVQAVQALLISKILADKGILLWREGVNKKKRGVLELSSLHRAIFNSDEHRVRTGIRDLRENPNHHVDGVSPLFLAQYYYDCANNSDYQVLKALVVAGAREITEPSKLETRRLKNFLHQRSEDPENKDFSALDYAISNGHSFVVQELISWGVDLGSKTGDLYPLDLAAKLNHHHIVILLNSYGAKGGEQSSMWSGKTTPMLFPVVPGGLHDAVLTGSILSVKRALEANPLSIDCLNDDGSSALHMAAQKGFCDVVKRLLESGAYVDMKTRKFLEHVDDEEACLLEVEYEEGMTPLHCAAKYGFRDVVRVLLSHKADVLALSGCKWMPLHYATFYGHENVVALLLEGRGICAINIPDDRGMTPLHRASFQDNGAIVKMLILEKNAYVVHAVDHEGCTALHIAAKKGNHGVVKILLENGARKEIKDSTGKTAYDYAPDETLRKGLA